MQKLYLFIFIFFISCQIQDKNKSTEIHIFYQNDSIVSTDTIRYNSDNKRSVEISNNKFRTEYFYDKGLLIKEIGIDNNADTIFIYQTIYNKKNEKIKQILNNPLAGRVEDFYNGIASTYFPNESKNGWYSLFNYNNDEKLINRIFYNPTGEEFIKVNYNYYRNGLLKEKCITFKDSVLNRRIQYLYDKTNNLVEADYYEDSVHEKKMIQEFDNSNKLVFTKWIVNNRIISEHQFIYSDTLLIEEKVFLFGKLSERKEIKYIYEE